MKIKIILILTIFSISFSTYSQEIIVDKPVTKDNIRKNRLNLALLVIICYFRFYSIG